MTNKRILLIAAASASFVAGSLSHGTERFDYAVRSDLFAGFAGNEKALARGMKKAEQVLQSNPRHAEALVWHGSALYFLAGQAFAKGDAEKGRELGEKAMEEMDSAVEMSPNDVAVRIPRGATLITATRFQEGPHVAPMVERALSDYQRAFDIQQAYWDKLGTHAKGELLLGLADGYLRTGDAAKARIFYARAAKELPGSGYQRFAQEWLDTGKLAPAKAGCLGCHEGK
jgi:tetratricopeptide (TPR) repeat protein